MYGLALCLPSVGQPQGLPVPHEIPKTQNNFVYYTGYTIMISPFHVRHFTVPVQLRVWFFILFVLLISQTSRFALFPLKNGLIPRTTHTEIESANMTQIFAQMPLYFIENQGQVDERISYYLQGQDKIIYFTPTGLTIIFSGAIESTPDAVGKQIVYPPDSPDQGY